MRRDLLVIGAGPAGMAAATAAAERGVRVTVVDENGLPGGQIFRRSPDAGIAGSRPVTALERRLRRDFEARNIEFWGSSTCVWADRNQRVRIVREGRMEDIEVGALIIATGTSERVFPVPGWTLPGVMTAGAAQAFLKGSGVVPTGRVLLAGNGPLQLAVAAELVSLGVQVAAVVENFRASLRVLGQAPKFALAPSVMMEGLGYLRALRRAGVPYLLGHAVTEITGSDKVERAVVSALDRTWRPIAGRGREFEVDSVLMSQGFTSSVQLLHLLGCALEYRAATGGWAPVRDRLLRTSRPLVYAAGDCAGVAGAVVSALEGEVAGRAAAQDLGYSRTSGSSMRALRTRWRLKRLAELRSALDSLTVPAGKSTGWMTPETIVCRCEEVSLGEIGSAIGRSASTGRDIKLCTRAGMGMCQGRMCEAAVQDVLAYRGLPDGEDFLAAPRFPCSPVRIGAWTTS